MNTKLLKKIKKDWTIVKYHDNTFIHSNTVFRALYKGKIVDYAWIDAADKNAYRKLILAIAYGIKFNAWQSWLIGLEEKQINRIDKRLKSTPRERDIKKGKIIWP
jgi:allantoicase